jgi:hypothetical protein
VLSGVVGRALVGAAEGWGMGDVWACGLTASTIAALHRRRLITRELNTAEHLKAGA